MNAERIDTTEINADSGTRPFGGRIDLETRNQRRQQSSCQDIWQILDQVVDPEIPALSIWDMGILQDVSIQGGQVQVVITPTYSGCPAMDVIKEDIESALNRANYQEVEVKKRLAPAWTTSWMSDDAKQKMRNYGIAAPTDIAQLQPANMPAHVLDAKVLCPRCGSEQTRLVSEFGSTACKALVQCNDCGEPFDYFKQL